MTKGEKYLRFRVIVAFETGLTLKEISEKYNIKQSFVLDIIIGYDKIRIKKIPKKVEIGYKDVAYYTEKEMLKGIPTYNVDSLSPSEKIILNSKNYDNDSKRGCI